MINTLDDHGFRSRALLALLGTFAGNVILWAMLSTGANRIQKTPPPAFLEVQRVVMDQQQKPKVIPPKPKPLPKKIEPPKPKPVEHQAPRPKPAQTPPPESAHNKVLIAKPTPNSAPTPQPFTAPEGGNAAQGKPIDKQGTGNATTNPPEAPPKEQPKVTPPVETPKATPTPATTPTPQPTVAAITKTKGPTKDAEPSSQVEPTIPESLKSNSLKTFVRVKVNIEADGSFKVVLRTSSGNPEVDKLVLNALQQWHWKPALREGEAVASTQLFKFEFEVK